MKKEASMHFELGGADRTLDIEIYGNELGITIDAPWAGSTEGGFGETLSAELTAEQAVQVARWILDHFHSPAAAKGSPSQEKA